MLTDSLKFSRFDDSTTKGWSLIHELSRLDQGETLRHKILEMDTAKTAIENNLCITKTCRPDLQPLKCCNCWRVLWNKSLWERSLCDTLVLIDCKYPLWCRFADKILGGSLSQNFPRKSRLRKYPPMTRELSLEEEHVPDVDPSILGTALYQENVQFQQAGKAIKCKFPRDVSSPIVLDKFYFRASIKPNLRFLSLWILCHWEAGNSSKSASHSRNEHLVGVLFVCGGRYHLLCF